MKIYWGAMVWRDMSARHGDCLARLRLLCAERGIGFENGTIYGDALVSRAQSVAASNFLRSDADVMLTCGSDTIFDPEEAIDMCARAMLVPYDIIGAIVLKRSDPPLPACPLPPGDLILDSLSEPVETKWMGTGFTATHRRVFEKLAPLIPLTAQSTAMPFWPFYQPSIVPDEKDGYLYLSEDWALAERAKAVGFRCWIDPRVRVGHLSMFELRLEDITRPRRPAEQPMRWRVADDGAIDVDFQDA